MSCDANRKKYFASVAQETPLLRKWLGNDAAQQLEQAYQTKVSQYRSAADSDAAWEKRLGRTAPNVDLAQVDQAALRLAHADMQARGCDQPGHGAGGGSRRGRQDQALTEIYHWIQSARLGKDAPVSVTLWAKEQKQQRRITDEQKQVRREQNKDDTARGAHRIASTERAIPRWYHASPVSLKNGTILTPRPDPAKNRWQPVVCITSAPEPHHTIWRMCEAEVNEGINWQVYEVEPLSPVALQAEDGEGHVESAKIIRRVGSVAGMMDRIKRSMARRMLHRDDDAIQQASRVLAQQVRAYNAKTWGRQGKQLPPDQTVRFDEQIQPIQAKKR